MISGKNFRMVDVHLNQELVDTLGEKIDRRRFTANLQLAIKRLINSFDKSPEEFTQKLLDNRSRVKVGKFKHQLVKRITVEFQVDDLSRLDRLLQRLKNQGINLYRQDLIRLSLLLWPDLA